MRLKARNLKSRNKPLAETHGGPAGANQGGAPRGSSRLDPSHSHEMAKADKRRRPSKTKR
jgi:hypothetical protein